MIVRAILDNPQLAEDFDYFNDFRDTRQWLCAMAGIDPTRQRAEAALVALDSGHEKHEAKRREELAAWQAGRAAK